MKSRAEQFDELAAGEFDLLIIGGGINGCGAARDAAQRGLRVALVEREEVPEPQSPFSNSATFRPRKAASFLSAATLKSMMS